MWYQVVDAFITHPVFVLLLVSMYVFGVHNMEGKSYYENRFSFESAFEEANTTFSDYKSQVQLIYQMYCQQSCPLQTKRPRNKYCSECFCDSACSYYGDCCPDMYMDAEKKVDWNCKFLDVLGLMKAAKMLDYCPEGEMDQDLVNNCQTTSKDNWRFMKPVTDIKTGVTFKNKYCAQCHGAVTTKWHTGVLCDYGLPNIGTFETKDTLYSSLLKAGCNIHFISPEHFRFHGCSFDQRISTCNETGYWTTYDPLVEKGCNTFPVSPVMVYKNVFCYMCNTYRTWADLKAEIVLQHPDVFQISLSALLDLDDGEEQNIRKTRHCPFTDPYQCVCRNISCSEEKSYNGEECRSIFKKTNSYRYNVCLLADLNFNSSLVSPNDSTSVIEDFMQGVTDIGGVHAGRIFSIKYLGPCAPYIRMVIIFASDIYFLNPVDTDKFERDLLVLISEVRSKHTEGMEMDLSFSDSDDCNPRVLSKRLIINSDLTVPCKTYMRNSISEFLVNETDVHVYWQLQKIIFTKVHSCPRILLSASEAQLSESNTSLLILATNTTLPYSQFHRDPNGVSICVNEYIKQAERNSNDSRCNTVGKRFSTLGLTSGICTSFSLLFLVITFVIFCKLKSLQTVTGMGIMALTVSLIWAQTLFEFGAEQTEIVWVCQTLGILTHFFWLSSTFWMNICTIILYYKLNFPMKSRHISSRKLMLQSTLYSWGCPFLIILAVILTSYIGNGTLGYGGSSCYITYTSARRYAFALPVGILVLVNIFLFVTTFIKLKWKQKLQSNQENAISMFGCIKLSVITGLTWIFAFIYEATRKEIFAYVFTILVGAQGLIVFLAFVANKGVFSQLKHGIKTPRKEERGQLKNTLPKLAPLSSNLKSEDTNVSMCTSRSLSPIEDDLFF